VETTVSGQVWELLLSALLGAALGVVYDLLAALRGRIGGRRGGCVVTPVCDLLFCALCVVSLFFFSLLAGGGALQLYSLFGTAAGMALFFLLSGRIIRRLGGFVIDGIVTLAQLAVFPFIFSARLVKIFALFCKNAFSMGQKQGRIRRIPKRLRKMRRGKGAIPDEKAAEAVGAAGKVRDSCRSRIRRLLRGLHSDPGERKARRGRSAVGGARNTHAARRPLDR
jgi:hypothetical protein